MKISLQLAQRYSNVDLTKLSVDELVQKVGSQLAEVEEVIDWAEKFSGILVVKVVICEKHPSADKLSVCRIDDGGATQGVERGEDGYVQVVCGAPNVAAGQLAIWIPPGKRVPSSPDENPFVLESKEIRGQKSNGMLASAQELAMGDDHSGIVVLQASDVQADTKPGQPLLDALNLSGEAVIDCENKMFTHRPDCFGVLGAARELAGIQQEAFVSPDWYKQQPKFDGASRLDLTIRVEESDLVPRFMAVALDGVKVKLSPLWLRFALVRSGYKPINNVVDITNYLMLITGQPIHAYDYDKVSASESGATLVARRARNDNIHLLNGKTLPVDSETLVIATESAAVGIAGVMGGSDTEVDENTKQVILEIATFDMYNIRRTSMKYGLFTDAATRYTKGQSPLQNDRVMQRAIYLVGQLTGGKQASAVLDEKSSSATERPEISTSADFINSRLGTSLSPEVITQLLTNVEFEVSVADGNLAIKAPFWRMDIEIAEDIVEEVGRLQGYDKLPVQLPRRLVRPIARDPNLEQKTKIRSILMRAGANEVLTYSFVHEKLLRAAGQNYEHAYQLSNALSPSLQYYRLSLSPSLLDKIHNNIKAGVNEFALFELNSTHSKQEPKTEEGLPREFSMLGLVFAASDKASTAYPTSAYFQAKVYADFLAQQLGLQFSYEPMDQSADYAVMKPFLPARSARMRVAGSEKVIGIIGEYQSETSARLKLPKYCAGFELSLDELLPLISAHTYEPAEKFPRTEQDICLEVADNTSYSAILECIAHQLDGQESLRFLITPLDIHRQDEAKLRFTFRVRLSHPGKTLTTSEVNAILDDIAHSAHEKLGAVRV